MLKPVVKHIKTPGFRVDYKIEDLGTAQDTWRSREDGLCSEDRDALGELEQGDMVICYSVPYVVDGMSDTRCSCQRLGKDNFAPQCWDYLEERLGPYDYDRSMWHLMYADDYKDEFQGELLCKLRQVVKEVHLICDCPYGIIPSESTYANSIGEQRYSSTNNRKPRLGVSDSDQHIMTTSHLHMIPGIGEHAAELGRRQHQMDVNEAASSDIGLRGGPVLGWVVIPNSIPIVPAKLEREPHSPHAPDHQSTATWSPPISHPVIGSANTIKLHGEDVLTPAASSRTIQRRALARTSPPDDQRAFFFCWGPYVKDADSAWDELKVYDQALIHCRDRAKRFYKWVSTNEGYNAWIQRGRKALTSASIKSAYLALDLFPPQAIKPRPCPASYKDNEKPKLAISTKSSPFQSEESLERREPTREDKAHSPLDQFASCWGLHTHENCSGNELERFNDAVVSCEKVAKGFYKWASTKRGFKEFSFSSRHSLAISLLRYFGPGASETDELCTSNIWASNALDLFHPSKDNSWQCHRPSIPPISPLPEEAAIQSVKALPASSTSDTSNDYSKQMKSCRLDICKGNIAELCSGQEKPLSQSARSVQETCRLCHPRNEAAINKHCKARVKSEMRSLYFVGTLLLLLVPVAFGASLFQRWRKHRKGAVVQGGVPKKKTSINEEALGQNQFSDRTIPEESPRTIALDTGSRLWYKEILLGKRESAPLATVEEVSERATSSDGEETQGSRRWYHAFVPGHHSSSDTDRAERGSSPSKLQKNRNGYQDLGIPSEAPVVAPAPSPMPIQWPSVDNTSASRLSLALVDTNSLHHENALLGSKPVGIQAGHSCPRAVSTGSQPSPMGTVSRRGMRDSQGMRNSSDQVIAES